jgi:hypothetical protein
MPLTLGNVAGAIATWTLTVGVVVLGTAIVVLG